MKNKDSDGGRKDGRKKKSEKNRREYRGMLAVRRFDVFRRSN